MRLQMEYWQDCLEAFASQAQELRALSAEAGDFVVTIALAVLGVIVGIALGRDLRLAVPLLLAASLESAVTIAAVAGATMYFLSSTGVPVGAPVIAMSLALALCASASSATP